MVPHVGQLQSYLDHPRRRFLVLHGEELAYSLHQELPAAVEQPTEGCCFLVCRRSWWRDRLAHHDLRNSRRMDVRPKEMGRRSAFSEALHAVAWCLRTQPCTISLHLRRHSGWQDRANPWCGSVSHRLVYVLLLLHPASGCVVRQLPQWQKKTVRRLADLHRQLPTSAWQRHVDVLWSLDSGLRGQAYGIVLLPDALAA